MMNKRLARLIILIPVRVSVVKEQLSSRSNILFRHQWLASIWLLMHNLGLQDHVRWYSQVVVDRRGDALRASIQNVFAVEVANGNQSRAASGDDSFVLRKPRAPIWSNNVLVFEFSSGKHTEKEEIQT